MIFTAIFPRFFQRDDIPRVCHDAESLWVAAGGLADIADGFRREMKANGAVPDLSFGIDKGLGQRLHFRLRALKQVKCQSLRRFGADARELLQFFDETGEGTSVNGTIPPWERVKRSAGEALIGVSVGDRANR